MADIRLNKYIAECGYCSRRKADFLIETGKVFVNGKLATMGQKINPEKDQVKVGDSVIASDNQLVYYALNKPRNVLSTASDDTDRKKVVDFVPKEPRVYPIGRLDYASEGLIILTNDGDLANILTHPKFVHQKIYFVRARAMHGRFKKIEEVHKAIKYEFENGLMIDGVLMKADSVEKIRSGHQGLWDVSFDVILHTGYNRQIRKMCDKIGLEVLKLRRTKIGNLELSKLAIEPGEYKEIKRKDIIDE